MDESFRQQITEEIAEPLAVSILVLMDESFRPDIPQHPMMVGCCFHPCFNG